MKRRYLNTRKVSSTMAIHHRFCTTYRWIIQCSNFLRFNNVPIPYDSSREVRMYTRKILMYSPMSVRRGDFKLARLRAEMLREAYWRLSVK